MNNRLYNIFVGICVIGSVVLALTAKYWIQYVNDVRYLFNDNITIGLIGAIVVLLTLYDCKLGVAFALLTAVVGYNLKNEAFTSYHALTSIYKSTPAPAFNNVPLTVKEGFQSPDQASEVIRDKMEKQMQLPPQTKCGGQAQAQAQAQAQTQQDFNTYTAAPDYHGYDVAGCRYDLKNSTQNGTIYGAPLSWCATYANNRLPTPFYPLHA